MSGINLGAGVPASLQLPTAADRVSRGAGPQMTRHARRQLGSNLAPGIGDSHGWNVAPQQQLQSVPEEAGDEDASYTSFTGTPRGSWGTANSNSSPINSSEMEATVASLISDCHSGDVLDGFSNLTDWVDFTPAPCLKVLFVLVTAH